MVWWTTDRQTESYRHMFPENWCISRKTKGTWRLLFIFPSLSYLLDLFFSLDFTLELHTLPGLLRLFVLLELTRVIFNVGIAIIILFNLCTVRMGKRGGSQEIYRNDAQLAPVYFVSCIDNMCTSNPFCVFFFASFHCPHAFYPPLFM